MKKTLISTILIIFMLVSIITVHAEEQTLDLIVTADKTEVSVGDELTYTVSIGAIKNLECIQFKIIPPTGLTFKSGTLVDGIQETLNAAVCGFNPERLNVVAGATHFSSTEPTEVLKLVFIVEEDFTSDPVTTDNWYNYAEDNTGEIKIQLITPHNVVLVKDDASETEKYTFSVIEWLISLFRKCLQLVFHNKLYV